MLSEMAFADNLSQHNATLTRIFLFFWVGPPIIHKLQAGGPAHNLQATSCQENYFYFLFDSWDIVGYTCQQEDTYESKKLSGNS